MELLLLEDIPGIGSKNDIIVVKEGFALNNLLPRRRAMVATPAVRKRYAEQIKRRAEERVREIELQKSAAGVLKDIVLEFMKKASKNGRLYAAISAKDIAELLAEKHQVEVAEADVVIEEEIKSLGAHTAKVQLGAQGEVPVKIEVNPEGAREVKAE
jgi:large subunit ribosomal protein L9